MSRPRRCERSIESGKNLGRKSVARSRDPFTYGRKTGAIAYRPRTNTRGGRGVRADVAYLSPLRRRFARVRVKSATLPASIAAPRDIVGFTPSVSFVCALLPMGWRPFLNRVRRDPVNPSSSRRERSHRPVFVTNNPYRCWVN